MQLKDSDRAALQSGCCDRPFQILGPHDRGDSRWLTVFHPDLAALWAVTDGAETPLPRLGGAALALTVAGILGSFACVALIRRFFTKTPTPTGISPQQKMSGTEAPNHEG